LSRQAGAESRAVSCNRMSTYNIRTTSWPIWILTLFITLAAFGFLLSVTGIDNIAVTLILMIGFVLASHYFQKFTSRGQVYISLTKTTIEIKYIKQSLFSRKPDRVIALTDVESYKYQPDRNFDLFKLTLKDQTELYFYHYTGFSGDDFRKLVLEFPKLVTDYNSHTQKFSKGESIKENKKLTIIQREKTLFEGSTGLLLAGVAIIFIGVFTYLLITNKVTNVSAGSGLLASISGAIFFLGQFFKYRTKEKAKP
jgi:hypothetical protein